MNIIAIGYAKEAFKDGSTEQERMKLYANHVSEFHMIVCTRKRDAFEQRVIGDSLFLYPTNSRTRLGGFFDAIRIGREIVRSRRGEWVITAQDPFEMGIVGTVLRAMLRVPLNVQEHGDFFSAPHWRTETVMNRIRYLIGLFVLRRADSVRVVSKRIQDTLIRKGVAPEKISVLPVRTDIQKWINGKTTVDLHAQYPNASPIILTAGRLVAQKNIDVLLLAFAKTVKRLPKALLVIIGTGAEERRLKQKAQTLGISECVVFMPWTDDLVSYMKTADIYALSSDYEGWGRVLVEAMACGLPVVTTDVGCAGEVFIDDRHGKIVPIRDADAFADALIALGLNIEMRQSYRDNALHDIKKLLETSEEDYAHKWVDILMRCRKGI